MLWLTDWKCSPRLTVRAAAYGMLLPAATQVLLKALWIGPRARRRKQKKLAQVSGLGSSVAALHRSVCCARARPGARTDAADNYKSYTPNPQPYLVHS